MNIFVAKLDYGVEDSELNDLFQQFGTVDSAKVIMDRETGRSKGFGFVEMPEDSEALQAIKELDGADVRGRRIVVKQAEERRSNDRGGFNRGGGGFNRGGGGGRSYR